MIVGQDKPPLGELAHFGVKGMKWGVHSTATPAQQEAKRVLKLQKKLRRIDSNKALNGLGLRSTSAVRYNKKLRKKDPEFGNKKFSYDEAKKYNRTVTRKAVNSVLLRGIPQVALILAGGNLAVGRLKASPQTIKGGRIGVAIIATQAASIMYSDISSISQSHRLESYQNELRKLQPNKRGGYI